MDSRWGKSSKYCKVLCVNMINLYAKTLFFSILPIKCLQIYELYDILIITVMGENDLVSLYFERKKVV